MAVAQAAADRSGQADPGVSAQMGKALPLACLRQAAAVPALMDAALVDPVDPEAPAAVRLRRE